MINSKTWVCDIPKKDMGKYDFTSKCQVSSYIVVPLSGQARKGSRVSGIGENKNGQTDESWNSKQLSK